MSDVFDELRAREPLFHRPELGTTRADFARMIVDDYWEIGASGARYDRALILDELERRYSGAYEDVWETRDFALRELGAGHYLVTYTLVQQRTRVTRRATIWRRTDDGWKAVYHQGTLWSAAAMPPFCQRRHSRITSPAS